MAISSFWRAESDRHALVLPLQPGEVLLLAAGVDALLAGRLRGSPEGAQDVAGGLLEGGQIGEALDIDGQEEMAERDGDIPALLVLAPELLQEGRPADRAADRISTTVAKP